MKYIALLASAIILSACNHECGCVAPDWQDARFILLDSAGNNLATSPNQFELYYLEGRNRIKVPDFSIQRFQEDDSAIQNHPYICQSGKAVEISAKGNREFYVEIKPGDIDTLYLEGEVVDDMHRYVHQIKFNGEEGTIDSNTWAHVFVKKSVR